MRQPREIDSSGTEVIFALADLRSSGREESEVMKYFRGAAGIIDFHKENPVYRDPIKGWQNQPPTSTLEFSEQWRPAITEFVTRFGGDPLNFDPVSVLRNYAAEIRRAAGNHQAD